jgi:hypothetical protein
LESTWGILTKYTDAWIHPQRFWFNWSGVEPAHRVMNGIRVFEFEQLLHRKIWKTQGTEQSDPGSMVPMEKCLVPMHVSFLSSANKAAQTSASPSLPLQKQPKWPREWSASTHTACFLRDNPTGALESRVEK